MKAGLVTYGFQFLLPALAKLHSQESLTVVAFDATDWHGAFWSDQADRLIGFVIVKRRTDQQEQERWIGFGKT